MIYSAAFDDLPAGLKEMVYARLLEVLAGHDASDDFLHLGSFERAAIMTILLETKSDLPAAWRLP